MELIPIVLIAMFTILINTPFIKSEETTEKEKMNLNFRSKDIPLKRGFFSAESEDDKKEEYLPGKEKFLELEEKRKKNYNPLPTRHLIKGKIRTVYKNNMFYQDDPEDPFPYRRPFNNHQHQLMSQNSFNSHRNYDDMDYDIPQYRNEYQIVRNPYYHEAMQMQNKVIDRTGPATAGTSFLSSAFPSLFFLPFLIPLIPMMLMMLPMLLFLPIPRITYTIPANSRDFILQSISGLADSFGTNSIMSTTPTTSSSVEPRHE